MVAIIALLSLSNSFNTSFKVFHLHSPAMFALLQAYADEQSSYEQ
uniref:Uncharacterized protein n=1 Tax=Anguilla anguilla TaxID=7936 RepID=A0A0E9TIU5_ANGAN